MTPPPSSHVDKPRVPYLPPNNAITLRTYWWGYELYIPEKYMKRLAEISAVAQFIVACLQTITLVVPAVEPFLGILAAFISLELVAIQAADHGDGVILAAVWPLPVVYFPRAWEVAKSLPPPPKTAASASYAHSQWD